MSNNSPERRSPCIWVADETFCEEVEMPSSRFEASMPDVPRLSTLESPDQTQIEFDTVPNEYSLGLDDDNQNSFSTINLSSNNDASMESPSVERQVLNSVLDMVTANNRRNGAISEDDNENFYTAEDATPDVKRKKNDEPSPDVWQLNCSLNLEIKCVVTYSKSTGLVLDKEIKNVKVLKPHNKGFESLTDSGNRASVSSAGSIYSDKSDLPYQLPPRCSVGSTQTSSTSTNEDNPTEHILPPDLIKRHPWKNMFSLTTACDDALMGDKIFSQNSKRTPISLVSLASDSLIEKQHGVKRNRIGSTMNSDVSPKRVCSLIKESEENMTPEKKTPVIKRRKLPSRSKRTRTKQKITSPEVSPIVPGHTGLSCSKRRPKKLKIEDYSVDGPVTKEEWTAWNNLTCLEFESSGVTRSKKKPSADSASLTDKYGQIPTKRIFHGMRFLLCYVKPNNFEERIPSSSNSEFSETDDAQLYDQYERVPFNEEHLRRQIEAGGGTVYQNFHEIVQNDRNVYLVTNRPNFSAKFITCLLHGVHILLHVHIMEACRSKFSQRMKLQHVGWSCVAQSWVEIPKNISTTLQGKSVFLFNEAEQETGYCSFWTRVIQKLGAHVVKDLNNEYADIIVSNMPLPKEMQETLEAIGTMAPSIVSLNWLKESIYQGFPVDSTLHKSFYFNYDTDS